MSEPVIEHRWADNPFSRGEWCVIEDGLVYTFGDSFGSFDHCEHAVQACRGTTLAKIGYVSCDHLPIRIKPYP